jgi:hypothetical protein
VDGNSTASAVAKVLLMSSLSAAETPIRGLTDGEGRSDRCRLSHSDEPGDRGQCRCEICASKLELELHHIGNRQDRSLFNCKVLCAGCHRRLHARARARGGRLNCPSPEYIVCLEDGKKFKSLKRHLRTQYNMTPEQYREKWALAPDYPMVAPSYAAARSRLAKQMGLGQQRGLPRPLLN